VAVFSAEDLRSLAAASRTILDAVVGDARQTARSRRAEWKKTVSRRTADRAAVRQQGSVQGRSFRRRLTRRLVKLALSAALLVVLVVVGAVLLVAHLAGAF
jgi:hypothetical protein